MTQPSGMGPEDEELLVEQVASAYRPRARCSRGSRAGAGSRPDHFAGVAAAQSQATSSIFQLSLHVADEPVS